MTSTNGSSHLVHLRVHTVHSIAEGVMSADRVGALCADNGMAAVGITNTTGLFDALEIAQTLSSARVRPIMGLTLRIAHKGRIGRVSMLAKTDEGWRNLMRLSTLSYETSEDPNATFRGAPLTLETVAHLTKGIFAIEGGPGSLSSTFGADGNEGILFSALAAAFPGILYHSPDLTRPDHKRLIEAATQHGIPLIAAPEILVPSAAETGAFDIVAAVATGRSIAQVRDDSSQPCGSFLSPAELAEAYSPYADALDNIAAIATACGFQLAGASQIMPPYDGMSPTQEMEMLRQRAAEGLDRRLANMAFPGGTADKYQERLALELQVIERTGFAGYFLTIADIVGHAHSVGIPVGPGRGSGAGSLVSYSLRITNIDPLRFGLLFERFLNPDRVSIPDIDIDFCRDRRDEVIDYIRRRFGENQVAHIITFQTIQSKSAIRDVGRVLGTDRQLVDQLCQAIPSEQGKSLAIEELREEIPEIASIIKREPAVADLIMAAGTIEGVYRQVSTHAAGVVIAGAALDTIVPVYIDPVNGHRVSQYSMKWAEAAGLVKHDILGLKTLTLIRAILDRIPPEQRPDFEAMDLSDPAVYEALSNGDTLGVFQLEGDGITSFLVKLKPSHFDDIVAMTSLYRPGPMEYIDTYINRRHGNEPVVYAHPLLEPLLRETQGIMIYQEQVIKVAQVLAGYSLAQADLLRRAMGKKIQSEMDAQKSRFVEGCLANGIDGKAATRIFDDISAFAGYGFNKSHATAYAVLAYQTAFLKVHFPGAFFSAYMTIDSNEPPRIRYYWENIRRHGHGYRGPDVNESDIYFTFSRDEKTGRDIIRHGLGGLSGLSHAAAVAIVAGRKKGPYRELQDLIDRCGQALNKISLTVLAYSGALDGLADRARVMANLGTLTRSASGYNRGQTSLFGDAGADPTGLLPVKVDTWTPRQRQDHEMSVTGFPTTTVPPRIPFYGRDRKDTPQAEKGGNAVVLVTISKNEALQHLQIEALAAGGIHRVAVTAAQGDSQIITLPARYRLAADRLERVRLIPGVDAATFY